MERRLQKGNVRGWNICNEMTRQGLVSHRECVVDRLTSQGVHDKQRGLPTNMAQLAGVKVVFAQGTQEDGGLLAKLTKEEMLTKQMISSNERVLGSFPRCALRECANPVVVAVRANPEGYE